VLFYNDDPNYPYSTSGTAFVVEFHRRIFVVTAKHVLRLREFRAEQFRVQYQPERPELIPTRALNSFTVADANDTDQFDVVAWEVDYDQLNAQLFGNHRPYRLNAIDEWTIFSEASDYLYRGYPFELRQIDFETGNYAQDSITGAATYLGRAGDVHCLHRLQFRNLDGVTDLDGLSGAPVFQTNRIEGKYSAEAFAGMLLRGARGPMLGHFLEHRRIIELLQAIEAGRVVNVAQAPQP